MGKPLINKKKWTQNEFRVLVVLLLTVLYPIFASSFFAIFFFVLMPFIGLVTAPHIYWLTASLIWVLLCAVILPCFRNTQAVGESLDFQGGPGFPTTMHAVQPFVKVEEVDEQKRVSILTNKFRDSSESIEKGMCEEKADKESLEKSKENLGKSTSSLEKGQITQSGEFLNECIDSLGPEKLQGEEAECQVHAEQENKDKDKQDDVDSADRNGKEKVKRDSSSDDSSSEDSDGEGRQDIDRKDDNKVTEDSVEVLEPIVEQTEKHQTEAAPLQVEEGNIQEGEIPGEEQVTELEDAAPVALRNPRPTIDTSRTSEYYECSMPTPKSASSDRPESNMVFLFVNPDMAATEKDIIVNHEGEVLEQKTED